MDVVNLPLLRYVPPERGGPLVISTGMATLGEIERAVRDRRGARATSRSSCCTASPSIPPEYDTIHLRNMAMLREAFDVPVGFSDHTLGTSIPLAAIALGACVIEKHFTLDKDMAGWDHAISADPAELRTIVDEGRNVFAALGSHRAHGDARPRSRSASKFRRSLVARRSAAARVTCSLEDDLDAKRPGTGVAPAGDAAMWSGGGLPIDVEEDHVMRWADLRMRPAVE